jgi:3D (Asp-Asp-Asp) domain-containing protein
MLNIKRAIRSRIKHFLFGNIMKKSQNYLPLTHRERAMIKWFIKFQAAMLLLIVSLVVPFQALYALLNDIRPELMEIPSPVAIASPEVKSEEISVYQVKSETIREVTAYNAGDPYQTDDSPCISANGEDICLALEKGYNRCAANFVPFGTELQIISPETGWEFQCLVVDRMNSRYPNRVDIAMKLSEKDRAIKFGMQKLVVRILESK